MLEIVLLCAGCHGMAGEGRPEARYPHIAGQPERYLERQLEAFADGRRTSIVMGPLAKRLSAGERKAVAAHFASQALGIPPGNKAVDDRKTASPRGRILAQVGDNGLRVQACGNCHGPRGTGRPPAAPYLAGLDAGYLRQELLAWRRGERRSDPSGAMGVIARHLTEADIEAVAAHYAGLPPPPAAGH
ncbi:MAG TPA: c-type cytochrome [Burkholderiales bacterium]|nr:c-type cytochrome [Burkholderiales bacterium]